MTGPQKRFCLLTTGRSGSTALMDRIQTFDDVALPDRNIDCRDNELLHPRRVRQHAAEYARLCGVAINNPEQLIEAFFRYNAAAPFAGFKSMPNRHRDYARFVARPDVTFITLIREDVPSTVASFLLAMRVGSWRRAGEAPPARWAFRKEDVPGALSNIQYLHTAIAQLGQVPNAIRLSYEQLCDPAFSSPELEAFFGRPVRIDDPKPPTSGSTYVENWDEFEAFAMKAYRDLDASAAAAGPASAS